MNGDEPARLVNRRTLQCSDYRTSASWAKTNGGMGSLYRSHGKRGSRAKTAMAKGVIPEIRATLREA